MDPSEGFTLSYQSESSSESLLGVTWRPGTDQIITTTETSVVLHNAFEENAPGGLSQWSLPTRGHKGCGFSLPAVYIPEARRYVAARAGGRVVAWAPDDPELARAAAAAPGPADDDDGAAAAAAAAEVLLLAPAGGAAGAVAVVRAGGACALLAAADLSTLAESPGGGGGGGGGGGAVLCCAVAPGAAAAAAAAVLTVERPGGEGAAAAAAAGEKCVMRLRYLAPGQSRQLVAAPVDAPFEGAEPCWCHLSAGGALATVAWRAPPAAAAGPALVARAYALSAAAAAAAAGRAPAAPLRPAAAWALRGGGGGGGGAPPAAAEEPKKKAKRRSSIHNRSADEVSCSEMPILVGIEVGHQEDESSESNIFLLVVTPSEGKKTKGSAAAAMAAVETWDCRRGVRLGAASPLRPLVRPAPSAAANVLMPLVGAAASSEGGSLALFGTNVAIAVPLVRRPRAGSLAGALGASRRTPGGGGDAAAAAAAAAEDGLGPHAAVPVALSSKEVGKVLRAGRATGAVDAGAWKAGALAPARAAGLALDRALDAATVALRAGDPPAAAAALRAAAARAGLAAPAAAGAGPPAKKKKKKKKGKIEEEEEEASAAAAACGCTQAQARRMAALAARLDPVLLGEVVSSGQVTARGGWWAAAGGGGGEEEEEEEEEEGARAALAAALALGPAEAAPPDRREGRAVALLRGAMAGDPAVSEAILAAAETIGDKKRKMKSETKKSKKAKKGSLAEAQALEAALAAAAAGDWQPAFLRAALARHFGPRAPGGRAGVEVLLRALGRRLRRAAAAAARPGGGGGHRAELCEGTVAWLAAVLDAHFPHLAVQEVPGGGKGGLVPLLQGLAAAAGELCRETEELAEVRALLDYNAELERAHAAARAEARRRRGAAAAAARRGEHFVEVLRF